MPRNDRARGSRTPRAFRSAALGGWLLAAWCAAAPLEARAAANVVLAQVREDAPARAARWFAIARREGERLAGERLTELQPIVADLRILLASQPLLRSEAAAALLDIASLSPRTTGGRARWSHPLDDASALAFEALDRGLDIDTNDELALVIAAQTGAEDPKRPMERRRAALEALRGRRIEASLPAMTAAADDAAREVRDAATAALSGWNHPEVHRAMIAQWLQMRSNQRWSAARNVDRHFASLRLPREGPLERALFEALRGDLLSRDWRAALRALRASEALDSELAVPTLIESLGLWVSRRRAIEVDGARPSQAAREAVSTRVEHEFVLALQRRSGKRIGAFPERWSRWWRTALDDPRSEGGGEHVAATVAGFYGLRPATDRVCFVIDRSGSMGQGGAGERSRYHRALAELEHFVGALEPHARFRIVLFSSQVEVWKEELVPATAASIAQAMTWAGYHRPDGGTELRPAIEHVMRLDRQGEPDLKLLEEDTVIVLCDGATADGPRWIAPLLERVGGATCLTFHCVQIGRGGGDGALRALAELSGGEYVETDG